MANPKSDEDPRPERQPEPEKNWRERFPGWETYEGKPNDPRFSTTVDPKKDPRFDTNLNPSAAVPKRLGIVPIVLGISAGILLFVLLSFLMFRHFQTPSPRSPQSPQTGRLIAPATVRMADGIADHALPLRKEHHVHEIADFPQTGALSNEKVPAQPKSRRALAQ
jgi:hypothetical protein